MNSIDIFEAKCMGCFMYTKTFVRKSKSDRMMNDLNLVEMKIYIAVIAMHNIAVCLCFILFVHIQIEFHCYREKAAQNLMSKSRDVMSP